MQLKILLMRREVVEQQHSALAARKEMFEGEDLTTIAQRVLRQEAHLRKAVEHHAHGLILTNLLKNQLGGFAELHFRGVEKGDFVVRAVAGLRRHELENRHSVKGPPMAHRY